MISLHHSSRSLSPSVSHSYPITCQGMGPTREKLGKGHERKNKDHKGSDLSTRDEQRRIPSTSLPSRFPRQTNKVHTMSLSPLFISSSQRISSPLLENRIHIPQHSSWTIPFFFLPSRFFLIRYDGISRESTLCILFLSLSYCVGLTYLAIRRLFCLPSLAFLFLAYYSWCTAQVAELITFL